MGDEVRCAGELEAVVLVALTPTGEGVFSQRNTHSMASWRMSESLS